MPVPALSLSHALRYSAGERLRIAQRQSGGLCGSISDVRRCGRPSAMSAAEKPTSHFDAMADHPAVTMSTYRRDGLNRALKAVERMPCSGGYHFKGLVVFITANFAFRHLSPHSQANSAASSLAHELPRFRKLQASFASSSQSGALSAATNHSFMMRP